MKSDDKSAGTIDLNYLKSEHYREAPCDGVVGGVTPHRKIWLAFYAERYPMPRIVRHALSKTEREGQVEIDSAVPPQNIEGRSGLIRNIEFGVYLNLDTATGLRKWLDEQIKQLEEAP